MSSWLRRTGLGAAGNCDNLFFRRSEGHDVIDRLRVMVFRLRDADLLVEVIPSIGPVPTLAVLGIFID